MTASPGLKDHIADLVHPLTEIGIVRYFGGWALRAGGTQVGMIMDTLYLSTELLDAAGFDTTRLEPFRYVANNQTVTVGRYRAVPPDLLDDPNRLRQVLTTNRTPPNESPQP